MKQARRHFLQTATTALLAVPLISFRAVEQQRRPLPALKPRALKKGDTIAITSPAGAIWDNRQTDLFVSILQNLGFKVKKGQTLSEHFGYFAGTDELRANELNAFFADPEVNAIFCAKGGWGCARLLPMLDFNSIAAHPKILMGFSDITSLLIAIQAKTGLVTYHGPVGNSGWNDFTMGYFKQVLMDARLVTFFPSGKTEDLPLVLTPGIVSGTLCGGNLSVLTGMMGSDYLPDWKNKILFLEDTGEEPYRIDRMLTQLKLCGVLQNLKGFVFGKCVKCMAEEPDKAFTFQQVLEQHIKPLGIPSFAGAMIGHIENKFTLPIGIEAQLDAEKGILTLLEAAVNG
ncbi:MAG TPA: LD-carboxypeptidase [Bacteroidia bacterium]|jgi:muramoyltetrapeptide carboxypeptidase|nr:LD-carboxypeptidase [Bacteroidia bacterium]